MSFTKIRYISATYPRRSSDLCIHAITTVDDGNYACIFGVADVLGGKKEKKIKALIKGRFETLLKSRLNWDIDTLAEAAYKEMLKLNSDIRKVGMECKRERLYKNIKQSTSSNLFRMLTTKFTSGELTITEYDNEVAIANNDTTEKLDDGFIYGSTLTLILICDDECRLFHSGDSRLYRLRSVSNKISNFESPCEVKCLTTDHTLLAEMMEERGFVSPSELLNLSKTLNVYLGMNEAKLNSHLSKEGKKIDIKTGDWFILMTDGLFLPIVRDMAGISANISREDFYIENWLEEFLYLGGYFHPLSMNGESKLLITGLLNRLKHCCSIHKHYRDSIAGIAVQLI